MFVHELLFLSLIVTLAVYLVLRTACRNSSAHCPAVILVLSWTLAVFAFLYTMSVSIACATDRSPQRVIYVLATLLLISNAVYDTALITEGKQLGPLSSGDIMRSVGVGIVGLTLAIYGMIRTSMWSQCTRTKALIKGAYLNIRDPNMSRQSKVNIAEEVIRSLELSPTQTKRILRLP